MVGISIVVPLLFGVFFPGESGGNSIEGNEFEVPPYKRKQRKFVDVTGTVA